MRFFKKSAKHLIRSFTENQDGISLFLSWTVGCTCDHCTKAKEKAEIIQKVMSE